MSIDLPLTSMAMVTLLLVVTVAFAGAAAADQHGDDRDVEQEYSTAAEAESDMQMHVRVYPDGADLVVTVEYDGNGSTHLLVETDAGEYQDSSSYDVSDERTLRVAKPDEPGEQRVIVEAPNGEVRRTVEYDTLRVDCFGVDRNETVIASMAYSWSVEAGGEEHSDSHAVDVAWQDVTCPAIPDGPDQSEFENALNESLAQQQSELEAIFEDAREAPEREEGGEEVVYDVGDTLIENHDDLQADARDAIRHVNETSHEAWNDGQTAIALLEERGYASIQGLQATLDRAGTYAENTVGHVGDETEKTANDAEEAGTSLGERVTEDVGEEANETLAEQDTPEEDDLPSDEDVQPDADDIPEEEPEDTAYDAGDDAIETHDEAQERARDGIQQANGTAHHRWGDAMNLFETGEDTAYVEIEKLQTTLDRAGSYGEGAAEHVGNESGETAGEAVEAGESVGNRIANDGSDAADERAPEANEAGLERDSDGPEIDLERNESDGKAEAEATVDANVTANATVDEEGVDASGNADVQASGSADIEASGSADIEASGSADIEATGSVGIEGAP